MTELFEQAIAIWRDCPEEFPAEQLSSLSTAYSQQQQQIHEDEFDLFLQSVKGELTSIPRIKSERIAAQQRISSAFVRLASSGLGLNGTHLRLLLDGGFSAIGTELGRKARRMSVPASVADILQASRNAWTACGLQVLFGQPMGLTPSIFAYSMLYPATDNYLDAIEVTPEAKMGFGLRFGERLSGEEVPPANGQEQEIWRLVDMIEGEHPRATHPSVYAGLLAIHHAQQESVRFQHNGSTHDARALERVSFRKGGASVLADARLAAPSLTREEERFAYCWGVFLQLADDLQDFQEDRTSGSHTLFTAAAVSAPLDGLTAKTLHFGLRVMEAMDCLPAHATSAETEDWSRPLKDLIRASTRSVVIRSAGELDEFYSPQCMAALERYSPCRFAFLRERRKQMALRRTATAMLFEAFLAGDDDEPAFPLLPSSLLPR